MMVLLSIIVAASVWLVNEDPGRGAAAVRMARGDAKTQNIAFTFSPAGTTIATTQSDRRVTLRDVVDGSSIRSVPGCRGVFMGLAFSPDGRFLALGGIEPDDITLLDLRGTGTERRLGMAIRGVKALAFSPDGKVLAATSFLHNEIVLWDMDAGRPLRPLRGHGSPVMSMAVAPDGQSLASGRGMMERSSSGISRSVGRVAAWRYRAARSIRSSIRRTAAGWLRSVLAKAAPGYGISRQDGRSGPSGDARSPSLPGRPPVRRNRP